MLQELDHELLVVVVGPSVRHSLTVLLLIESELGLEQVKKIFEQKIDVDISADVFGQFAHKPLVRLARRGIVFVVTPVIIKVVLNF